MQRPLSLYKASVYGTVFIMKVDDGKAFYVVLQWMVSGPSGHLGLAAPCRVDQTERRQGLVPVLNHSLVDRTVTVKQRKLVNASKHHHHAQVRQLSEKLKYAGNTIRTSYLL